MPSRCAVQHESSGIVQLRSPRKGGAPPSPAPVPRGGALQPDSCCVVILAEQPVAAAEWRLRWSVRGDAGPSAVQVLRGLHINPRSARSAVWPAVQIMASELGLRLALPPPLAASFTLALAADSASISMQAPASLPEAAAPAAGALTARGHGEGQPAAVMDALATLRCERFAVAYHSYDGDGSWAVDLRSTLSAHFVDSTTLVEATLVEPCALDAIVECRPASEPIEAAGAPLCEPPEQAVQGAGASTAGGQDGSFAAQRAAGRLFWEQATPDVLPGLAARPPPARQGMSVGVLAGGGPLVLNATELTPHELRRLVAALRSPAAAMAPMLLCNESGLALVFRQAGTREAVPVPPGGEEPYWWAAPPGLLPGTKRSLQLAWSSVSGQAAGAKGGLRWSVAVEASPRRLPIFPPAHFPAATHALVTGSCFVRLVPRRPWPPGRAVWS